MHAYYLSVLQQQLAPKGICTAQLLAGSGVSEQQIRSDPTLSAAQLDTVCSNALALSGDPHFGLKLGMQINMVSQGILGYALLTSATAEDALKLLVRYNRAILPSINISLQRSEDNLELQVQVSHLPRELQCAYTEILFAAVINNGRILKDGARRSLPRLELDYEPDGARELLMQIFGSNVSFQCTRSALIFDAHTLGATTAGANPLAQEIFRRECDRILSIDRHRGSVSERVQQVLLQAGSEFPNAAVMAQKLNMSESTLQRRLVKEGCRYQQLLDRVRYRLAHEYLTGTTLPVVEIAQLLGFSDAANFRRSFKRWCDTTPSKIRSAAANAVTA